MSMGLQTFVKGTTFDAVNTIQFNYIVDVLYVNAGSGSVSYPNIPSSNFTLTPINTLATTGSRGFSYSQSGNTVSWTASVSLQIIVIAEPVSGSNTTRSGFGLQLFDGNKIKMAPDFVPFNLVQVLDVTPSVGDVYQLIVPSSDSYVVFHRGISEINRIKYTQTTQNGYAALKVDYCSAIPTRIYVFSATLVNPPNYGAFIYKNGKIVWHSNCLPLKVSILDNTKQTISSSSPLAVVCCVSSNINIGSGSSYYQWYYVPNAGYSSSDSVYKAQMIGYQYLSTLVSGSAPATWSVPTIGYIDCTYYDAYYKASLGYS